MTAPAPKIDDRKADDIVREVQEIAPFYTPEWLASDETDAGLFLQANPGQHLGGYDLRGGLRLALSEYVAHNGEGSPVCLAGDRV